MYHRYNSHKNVCKEYFNYLRLRDIPRYQAIHTHLIYLFLPNICLLLPHWNNSNISHSVFLGKKVIINSFSLGWTQAILCRGKSKSSYFIFILIFRQKEPVSLENLLSHKKQGSTFNQRASPNRFSYHTLNVHMCATKFWPLNVIYLEIDRLSVSVNRHLGGNQYQYVIQILSLKWASPNLEITYQIMR